ncbi:hypothetical protein L9F63_020899 [Diploptera punctata]|uniref:Protein yellow n=1 Tax=Diploptera punctata TaxID=6984 RepID=A0AAD7ZPZ5_DIPPU|nr:hypothetical protein L9F63_020899 [Diploptera punctata]
MMLVSACLLSLCATAALSRGLDVVFEWKQLQFDLVVDRRNHVPENNVPVGLEVWKDKLFITVPRWKPGVPVSLAYVNIKEAGKNMSPVLKPYPNSEAHDLRGDNMTRLVSPFRVRADSCDRLWVLDTGLIDILGQVEHVGPNQLLVYDLNTDKLLRRYEIPHRFLKNETFFANIAVDVKANNCEQTFAYLADLGTNSLVVYRWETSRAWQVRHHYFHNDPMAGDYNVSGLNFQWTDGLFGLALSGEHAGYRTLYFHPFSSYSEFSVSTKVLQNETLWFNHTGETYHLFEHLGTRGPHSQSCASFLDEKTGVLFYTQVARNSVGCWNSRLPYNPATQGEVDANDVTMVFPNDVKVDRNRKLWVLTDRMPIFMYGKLNYSDVNFRILSAPVDRAIAQTVCADGSVSHSGSSYHIAVLPFVISCFVFTTHF